MSNSLLDSCKKGTIKLLKKTTKININNNILDIIDKIYSKLDVGMNMLINYKDGYDTVTIGNITDLHNMIVKYIIEMNDFNTFTDFLTQKRKHTINQIEGHEDLVVDGMEERYINEEYAPKDKLKIELPVPYTSRHPIECNVCCKDAFQIVKCNNCKALYCYQCCVEQAKRTGRCPLCNCNQTFETITDIEPA